MDEHEHADYRHALQQNFSPGAPVRAKDLFAGRISQLRSVLEAIEARGRHTVIYGERGVGKTSLANIVAAVAAEDALVAKVNCDSDDDFGSVWRKVFRQLTLARSRKAPGFTGSTLTANTTLETLLPETPAADDIQRLLELLRRSSVVILDELDRIRSQNTTRRLADTIKTLSDNSVPSTLVLVGVADSVSDLVAEHLSIERALVQVQMPRMSPEELGEIVDRGFAAANLGISLGAKRQVVALSQGLPHYTHSLSLFAGHSALDRASRLVDESDVQAAVRTAVTAAQQSILQLHHRATSSPRRENLYGKVLLAAAMAPVDQLGYFAAADVREPMRKVTGKKYQIPSFSRHLHDLCDPRRGPVLQKAGAARKLRFRFVNPLLQPFVLLNGISQGLLRADFGPSSRGRLIIKT